MEPIEKTNTGIEQFGYEQTLSRVMDFKMLVFFGLAYLAPCTIFTTYGIVTGMTHGMLSLSYLVATIAMLFTALSYSHMVKAYPIAGSVYSYVTRTIHPHAGFLAGWIILMDYLLLPLINFVGAGIFINAILPFIPTWSVILSMLILVTVINCLGIRIASNVNTVLVIISMIFVLAIIFFSIKWILGGNGSGTLLDMNAFINLSELNKPDVGISAILGGASILALSFLGFDSVTTVAEEATEPEKNIGKAIITVCLGAGFMFVITSYIFQLAWPEGWCQFENVEAAANELISKVAGQFMQYVFIAIIIICAGASAIASQASAARILFGMGRDGALPKKFFAQINTKHKTPTNNILLIAALSLTGLFMNIEIATSIINFGALAGFTLVNITVIVHYFVRKKQRNGIAVIKYLILPIIGAIICGSLWLNLASYAKILGFIWLFVGLVWLAYSTKFFKILPPDMKLDE